MNGLENCAKLIRYSVLAIEETCNCQRSCIEAVCNFSSILASQNVIMAVLKTFCYSEIQNSTLSHISQDVKDMIMRCVDLLHLMSMIYYICLEIVLV